ncbi:MAG: alternative ribosome rescue aminoacyl-tRNA hydrolase ArfB [Bacteroidota bacterium]
MNNLAPISERGFEREFIFLTSRSSGAGGQHINKTETKVELRFHVSNSELLTENEKILISLRLKSRITDEGYLQIIVQESRSQSGNKEIAIERFYEIIAKALIINKIRRASKPSKSSITKRLDSKKIHSKTKESRKKIDY